MINALPDQTSARAELANRRPRNDRELWLWIHAITGYKIPWRPVCEHHQAPFVWLADAYFERVDRTLIRASRDSGKTLGYALLDLLNSHHKPGCATTHVGSTETQSKDGYAHLSGSADKHGKPGLVRQSPLSDYLADEPMMERTVWKNGSLVRILTGGSEQSVSGPHPQKAVLDEVDHWKPAILNTAMLMPRSQGEVGSQTFLASSQYNSFGTMAGLLVEAPKRGFRVYEWCLFDVMAHCPHCPNGRGICPLYEWQNPLTGQMEPLCKGRGEQAAGHLAYRDACNKFLSVDAETAALQLLLVGGSRSGLVYPQFIDEPYPAGHIGELPHSPPWVGWRFWAGVDLRTHSVIECIAQSPQYDYFIFDEWSNERAKPSDTRAAAVALREKWQRQAGINLELFWLDPSQPDEALDWSQTYSIPALPAERRPIMYGVRLIRDLLSDVLGRKRLYISSRCQRLALELGKLYHLDKNIQTGKFDPDRPVDEDNHAADSLRYGLASGPPPSMEQQAHSYSMVTL